MVVVIWGAIVIGAPARSRMVPHQRRVAARLVTASRVPGIAEEPGVLGRAPDVPASKFQSFSARDWCGTSDVQYGGSNGCDEEYDGCPHGHISSDFVE